MPFTASRLCAATTPPDSGRSGATPPGRAPTAVGATASRATGTRSPSTVNSQAGTSAAPRLVRTGAVPSFTPVTVSGTQGVSTWVATGPSGPGSIVGPPLGRHGPPVGGSVGRPSQG